VLIKTAKDAAVGTVVTAGLEGEEDVERNAAATVTEHG
jgi:hypothetical protein